MTKSELTNLLGMETLVRQNNKTKSFNTMLDIVSNYLATMKGHQGGVSLPSTTTSAQNSTSASKQLNRNAASAANSATETTQASTSSF